MMRILLVTPDFPPRTGGIQHFMSRLVDSSNCGAWRVITPDADGSHAYDRHHGLDVRRTSAASGWIGRADVSLRAFRNALAFRPDVVVSGHVVVAPGAVAIHRALGAPIVQYLYGKEVLHRPALTRFATRAAEAVVAISSYTAELAVRAGAPRDRLHIIPPGVDLPPGPVGGGDAGEPIVLTVSRLNERYKGHDVLLRAMPLIVSRVPEARLVVIGDGRLREVYARLSAALRVEGSVSFVGAATDEQRELELRRARVFAMPSRGTLADGDGEGFGIVYLEAAAHGVPVVAGRAGGTVDAVVDGETGLLVDPEDHVAVAEAITGLLVDPARAAALGERAMRRAQDFAWPLIAARHGRLLRQVADR